MPIDLLPAIRVRADEYEEVPRTGPYVHFNLAPAEHRRGVVYALPRIVRPGVDGPDGYPPELDFDGCLVGRCLDFRPVVGYSELTPADFDHAMSGIRTVDDLRQRIGLRYCASRPFLGPVEREAMGVSITLIEMIA